MQDMSTGLGSALSSAPTHTAQPLRSRAELGRSSAARDRLALVVDDDEQVRCLLTKLLSSSGFRCLPACNGEQALRLLEGHRPHLGVLDIVLPGMSGAELAWRIKEHMPDLPLVAVSRHLHLWDPDDLVDLGFSHILPKPLDCPKFLRLCRRICAGGSASPESLASPRP